jgi:hypothetical protein
VFLIQVIAYRVPVHNVVADITVHLLNYELILTTLVYDMVQIQAHIVMEYFMGELIKDKGAVLMAGVTKGMAYYG